MPEAINDAVLREAANWLVQLDGSSDAQLQARFHAWLSQSPAHAAAAARLQGQLGALYTLPAHAARNALRQAPRTPRPGRVKALALALALLPAAWFATNSYQQGYLFADLSTRSGHWLERELDDGSQLYLDGDSAVDVKFDGGERRVQLLRGEVLVEVAKDPRPLRVVTPHGSVRALGTRFTVERQDDATLVTMLESTTAIDSGGRTLQLTANQRIRLSPEGPGTVEPVQAQPLEHAWHAHQLLAVDQPLNEVLTRLARHYPGVLLADRAALLDLRVTVMLPLDDPRQALRLLQRTLPIEVSQYTPWITRVSLKSAAVGK
ncbi:FecR family protein [Pseudomonas cremoricolorata]|uniref:Iron dicitrate transport regulator FecR n=1 Tax=Pseudomonas cremoricolorata TaxID=157783 RepID=A0A089WLW6_9PSED|nr:FecR domain-containing protein [Pseudomonas cremoricolorata]AIR88119.1 iron dicitrate transport regulator FecR [Pseudomonas cremoricolorata]